MKKYIKSDNIVASLLFNCGVIVIYNIYVIIATIMLAIKGFIINLFLFNFNFIFFFKIIYSIVTAIAWHITVEIAAPAVPP